MFLKFQIRLVERNRAIIEIHMKIGSTNRKESSRNRRNPKLLKEKAIFLLHISIGRETGSIGWITKKQKFLKNPRKTFLQNHLKNCFYDMAWMFMTSNDLRNQNFQRKKSILSNFLTFFFSHTPQKNALNTSRSLILEGHKTQHTITCNKFYKVCLWCVEDSFFAPHGNTSLPTHATSTYY